MRSKTFKRILFWVLAVPPLVLSAFLLIVYARQDAIVQAQIATLNNTYKGKIAVGDVQLAPFKSFPYISLKIDDVTVHESKVAESAVILDVADIYIGFNIWNIIIGDYDIQSLLVEDGFLDLVLHTDGRTNLENALASSTKDEGGQALAIHLHSIALKNIDVHQREESTNMDIETLIYWAKGGFNTGNDQIAAHIDSEFELNVIDDGDTTYFKHKHFELHTDVVFNKTNGLLLFEPSGIKMEHGDFQLEGAIDTRNEMTVDIAVKGTKPNFDMFIAFAPTKLIPVLERYENAGEIYFNASLQGPTTNGRQPLINASFGAKKAYLENSAVNKRIDDMGFSGHFTNGADRNVQSMEFSLTDITANLEKGNFVGSIQVKNFDAPEIDMQVDADFDIPFLVSFLNLTEVRDATGSVEMKLKFHDIIDIENPEKALSDLNQAYYAELKIKDLTFSSSELPYPLKDLDVQLVMNGKQAQLSQFNLAMGSSQLSITGLLSDLPAIVHQTSTPLVAKLAIKSNILDLAELTGYTTADSVGINERIENLSLTFSFNALGNAFRAFKHLPKGEFFIDDLYADLKHYPHSLHDFHADILVKEDDLNIIDFSGFVDDSDFHFNGLIHDYSAWMQDELNGDIDFDITLKSKLLKFDDLFTYQGENYVPKDYRHEEIDGLELHMESKLHYNKNALTSIAVKLDKLEGKLQVHPLRFENFNGRFKYEKEHLMVQDFKGKMGRTTFDIDMNYYLGKDQSIKKRDNLFSLKSDFIDFDALSSFNIKAQNQAEKKPQSDNKTADVAEHAEAFNLYELPFTDMQFNVDIRHFMYHRLDLKNVRAQLRSTQDHYIYLDTVSLDAAGGHIALNGYFNGSDPTHIFLEPTVKISGVDLDKLLFKFENFGQDAIISENLHGALNASIIGKIRVYPDFMVDLDQSEVHLDAQILSGRLENYDPVMLLSDYFGDKDLTNIKFDTLQNHMDISNGKITIPNMTIKSTLGHLDISGSQDMDGNIDYYARIPWSLVKGAARNKLFGSKNNDATAEDEIVELDAEKKIKYLNLNITGTLADYSIKTKKAKKGF
ncbi:MAG: hypothetical protein ACI9XJ_001354 [Marivirga sp.]|jgi:hypothetical protein